MSRSSTNTENVLAAAGNLHRACRALADAGYFLLTASVTGGLSVLHIEPPPRNRLEAKGVVKAGEEIRRSPDRVRFRGQIQGCYVEWESRP
jgi:hypothetical protein